MVNRPLSERLASRLVRVPSGCLEWTGYRTPLGYGQIGRGSRAEGVEFTHRIAWEVAHGRRIPRGWLVRHRCDNPPCCEPSHLVIGRNVDNVRDMMKRGRQAVGATLPHTRLTDDDVRTIRASYDPKFGPPKRGGRRSNATELAERFGVSRSYIMQIVHGHYRTAVA